MFRRIKHILLQAALLLLGLYSCAQALWNMGKTAVFLHESVVIPAQVTDMVQYPFESFAQAIAHGNLPWEGNTAYQATVSFTLPTKPLPITITGQRLPDLDNRDYDIGQQVDIIVPLTDPECARLYRWKFQWGADCLMLLAGLLLSAAAYLSLRRRHRKKAPASNKKSTHKRAAAHKTGPHLPQTPPAPVQVTNVLPTTAAPAKAARNTPAGKSAKKHLESAAEEVFQLVADPPAPKKKRSRKPKDPNAPPSPRRRKKKNAA